MRLTKSINEDNYIMYKGRMIRFNTGFDIILKSLELCKDKAFTDFEKFFIWSEMLMEDINDLEGLNEFDMIEIVNQIFDKLFQNNDKSSKSDKKLICFSQDAEFIYASFKAEYGIDLFEEQGSLSWMQFMGLFKGLSDKSKIKEIAGIRAAKVPKQTKHNKDEVKRLRELKELYALEEDPTEKQSRAEMLNRKLSAIGDMIVNKGR